MLDAEKIIEEVEPDCGWYKNTTEEELREALRVTEGWDAPLCEKISLIKKIISTIGRENKESFNHLVEIDGIEITEGDTVIVDYCNFHGKCQTLEFKIKFGKFEIESGYGDWSEAVAGFYYEDHSMQYSVFGLTPHYTNLRIKK